MYTHCNGAVIIDENDIGKTDIQILTDLIYETNKIRIPKSTSSMAILPSWIRVRTSSVITTLTFLSSRS